MLSAKTAEVETVVEEVYRDFLGHDPEGIAVQSNGYDVRVVVTGARSRLEQSLVDAGRFDLVRRERDVIDERIANAVRHRTETTTNTKVADVVVDSDPRVDADTLYISLAGRPTG